MDKLLNSSDISEVLQCSRDRALIYMRTMRNINISSGRVRENLRVWESDFMRWLTDRSSEPLPPRRRGRKQK